MARIRPALPARGWKPPRRPAATSPPSSPRSNPPPPSGAPRIITSAISRSMAAPAMSVSPNCKRRTRLNRSRSLPLGLLFAEAHGHQHHDHGGETGERAGQPDDQPAIMLVVQRRHVDHPAADIIDGVKIGHGEGQD